MEDFYKKFNDEDDGDAIREFKRKELIFDKDEEYNEFIKTHYPDNNASLSGEIYFPPQLEKGFGF